MHGRLKVRTSAQEQEAKRKEREQKVRLYKAGIASIFKKRAAGELDDELLSQAAQMLLANPDIYTLWNIRKEILEKYKTEKSDTELSSFIDGEVQLTEQCLRTNPKSYGAWHHRGWVLERHPSPNWKRELALCTKFLMMDERNFHCWDYRRLAAERSNVAAEDEFLFSTAKIEDNFSNYSAWHYRSKLLPITHPDPQGICPISSEKHRQELELVQNAAFTDPNDTSAWFYQRWLLGRDCSLPHRPRAVPILAWVDSQSGLVVCSEPCQPGISPKLIRDSEELVGQWNQVSSHIWVIQNNDLWSFSPDTSLQVESSGRTLLLKPVPEHENCFWSKEVWGQENYSPNVMAELQGQLGSCKQLLDLEPDSKWTLLTSVLLMQAIDGRLHHGDCMQALDKLPQLDPLRTGYYQDLRSKYLMEFQLPLLNESSETPVLQISLSNRGLSALYYMHLLALVKKLDLSHNELIARSLPALSALQHCTHLILDDNKLVTLDGLPHMPALICLSLRDNLLTETPGIISSQIKAAKLASLCELYLDNNACQGLPDIKVLYEQISKNK